MATLTFLGAAREVTGSCHMLESEAIGRVLLDCGMHQGGDATERIKKDNFQFDPDQVDAVILSHAHLDHSGLLPKLVHQGFTGPIYCTPATRDLLRILLNDSLGLYERDLDRDNLKRRRRGEEPLEAEYNGQDVERTLELCEPQRYRTPVKITDHATLTFQDAGHILGSAIVELEIIEDSQPKKLVFSGDLGKRDSLLMNDPAEVRKADVVLMESTYGDRDHRNEDETLEQLSEILSTTWQRGGNVFIPSFAVGRAQELIFNLGQLHHRGQLDDWQIFLDSPMAIEVTRVYDNWLHIMDHDDVRQLSDAHRSSLEGFLPSLKCCVTPEESMAINNIDSGALVIAGSGMCTGGRIRHHFKHRIWHSNNTIIFVGFQARGTLGRLLVDGLDKVRMFGDEFAVKAQIETLGGFSAHAGQQGLIDWISRFEQTEHKILVHGEEEAMQTLSDILKKNHGVECKIPFPGERFQF
ncbi:MAG: MBL fold metallo-hydrolase [Gammaproteobacteria bacterium]|nr:MBL fold metallo-hydrolase [Gammaproteobacteria bacterium]